MQNIDKLRPLGNPKDTPSFGSVLADLLVHFILEADDPSERKERIMIAWEDGHITAGEASAAIIALDLVSA